MHLLRRFTFFCALLTLASGAAIRQQSFGGTNQVFLSDNSVATEELRQKVQGRLIDVTPVGKPCYSPNSFDSPECIAVNGHKRNDFWLTDQPGGYYYSNWASCQATDQTCTLPMNDTLRLPQTAQCHQGSVPSLAIDLQNVTTLKSDIQAAFEWANTTGQPLVVKNTGHNIIGRSNAPNALALWTHRLQHPVVPAVLDREFVPSGCSGHAPEAVFHFGPGQQWGGAFRVAEASNFSLLGGTCPSVGIAGWLQGGGHSPLTPIYGMGVDNVRQLEIVTPRNGVVVANECQNQDLYFAARGGGGGTWGVITNITYKAIPKLAMIEFHFNFTGPFDQPQKYIEILTFHAVEWSKKGWGGYLKLNKDDYRIDFVNPKISLSEAMVDMKDLTDFLTAQNHTYRFQLRESWYNYTDEVMSATHIGFWSMSFASRLLPRQLFKPDTTGLVDALMHLVHKDKLVVLLMMVAPTAFSHTTTSALHPSWKDAILSVRVSSRWDQFDDSVSSTTARSRLKSVHDSFDIIRHLAPDMGTSINEADIWEEHHEQHYWGEANYQRLLKVKNNVDPDNLLTNYGAVKWRPDDARYKCYPKQ